MGNKARKWKKNEKEKKKVKNLKRKGKKKKEKKRKRRKKQKKEEKASKKGKKEEKGSKGEWMRTLLWQNAILENFPLKFRNREREVWRAALYWFLFALIYRIRCAEKLHTCNWKQNQPGDHNNQ